MTCQRWSSNQCAAARPQHSHRKTKIQKIHFSIMAPCSEPPIMCLDTLNPRYGRRTAGKVVGLVQRFASFPGGEFEMAEETVLVVPTANPAALGLVAFGLTTVLLSLVNAGVLPAAGGDVVIPLALAFGGLMQIFAGAFEFRLGNTFGMTAFLSYGAFWWWHAFMQL